MIMETILICGESAELIIKEYINYIKLTRKMLDLGSRAIVVERKRPPEYINGPLKYPCRIISIDIDKNCVISVPPIARVVKYENGKIELEYFIKVDKFIKKEIERGVESILKQQELKFAGLGISRPTFYAEPIVNINGTKYRVDIGPENYVYLIPIRQDNSF